MATTAPVTRTQATTATSPRSPLRLWVIGDSGAATPMQAAVTQAYQSLVKSEGVAAQALVANGDIAYMHGTDEQFQVSQ